MINKKCTSLLVLCLASLLVGCGSGSSPATSGDSSESKTVYIDVWHTFGQTIMDAFDVQEKAFVKLVKENEGVDIVFNKISDGYQGGYSDIETKVISSFSTNATPTMTIAYPDHVANYLAEEGNNHGKYVVNLENYANDNQIGFGKESYLKDRYGFDDFVQAYANESTNYAVEGMYSIPFMKSTEIMFYNVELLQVAMEYYKPEIASSVDKIDEFMRNVTWEDFMGLCASIKANMSKISNVLEVPLYYDSDANLIISQMFQSGIEYDDVDKETGKGIIKFSSDTEKAKLKTLLTDLKSGFDSGYFTTKGIENSYGSDYYKNEKCIFSVGSSAGTGYSLPKKDQFTVGICKVPSRGGNDLYVNQGLTWCVLNNQSISSEENALRTKYAWKFIKYITNTDVNANLCINGSEGYTPVRESSYETANFQQYLLEGEDYAKASKVVISQVNGHYFSVYAFKGSSELRNQIGACLTDVLNKNTTTDIDTAISTAISNALLMM